MEVVWESWGEEREKRWRCPDMEAAARRCGREGRKEWMERR